MRDHTFAKVAPQPSPVGKHRNVVAQFVGVRGESSAMRLSTSPVGPLSAIALSIALLIGAGAAHAEELQQIATGEQAVSPDDLRGSVDGSAWAFLYPQESDQGSSVEARDLPAPQTTVAAPDDSAPEKPLSAEERARLSEALTFEPLEFGAALKKPRRVRSLINQDANRFDVTRSQRPDGSSTVVFKKPIAPVAGEWNAKVGADLGMVADSGYGASERNPLRVARDAQDANAAWASVDVHEFATVDARVNPGSDQGVVATTFKRSMPIGSTLSMTLQSRTSVTETFRSGTATSSDIPMMVLPSGDGTTAQRVWDQDSTAKLNILSTGTTLGAGVSSNSTDTIAHNILMAEQNVYGPLQVSTSITDPGQTGESKSVNARLKFHW
ncbi:MAG: hypothetical protein WC670_16185 [Pseudolabrys sp.]